MKRSLSILFFICLFFSGYLFAQNDIRLSSPDGRIVFTLRINEGIPVYSVVFNKNVLIENSSLNLEQ
ncbi:MAG TPA: hypothetical protein VI461_00185, partial [Chitinophagaceae bacterium]|nr:hypothetical protein [Chitinophagaceae bacterium]